MTEREQNAETYMAQTRPAKAISAVRCQLSNLEQYLNTTSKYDKEHSLNDLYATL